MFTLLKLWWIKGRLGSPDRAKRLVAADRLSQVPGERAERLLIGALSSADPEVCRRAMQALRERQSAAAVPHLVPFVPSEDCRLAEDALSTLYALAPDWPQSTEAQGIFDKLLDRMLQKHHPPTRRQKLLSVLIRINKETALQRLLPELPRCAHELYLMLKNEFFPLSHYALRPEAQILVKNAKANLLSDNDKWERSLEIVQSLACEPSKDAVRECLGSVEAPRFIRIYEAAQSLGIDSDVLLNGLLRCLPECLPGEYRDYLDRLGPVQNLTEQYRKALVNDAVARWSEARSDVHRLAVKVVLEGVLDEQLDLVINHLHFIADRELRKQVYDVLARIDVDWQKRASTEALARFTLGKLPKPTCLDAAELFLELCPHHPWSKLVRSWMNTFDAKRGTTRLEKELAALIDGIGPHRTDLNIVAIFDWLNKRFIAEGIEPFAFLVEIERRRFDIRRKDVRVDMQQLISGELLKINQGTKDAILVVLTHKSLVATPITRHCSTQTANEVQSSFGATEIPPMLLARVGGDRAKALRLIQYHGTAEKAEFMLEHDNR